MSDQDCPKCGNTLQWKYLTTSRCLTCNPLKCSSNWPDFHSSTKGVDEDGQFFVALRHDEYERARACVKTCEGLPDEMLSGHMWATWLNYHSYKALEQKNTELVEAVKHFLDATGGQCNAFGQRAVLISKLKSLENVI